MADGSSSWALQVRTVQGGSTSLQVDSSHTIGSIKARLAERNLETSADGLSVLFLGHALADEATLGQAGVTAGDYLVSFWASSAKKRKKNEKRRERDTKRHQRLSTEADDNDDLYSGFGRDHGTATPAEQQLVHADEDASTRAAVVGGSSAGWQKRSQSLGETLTCAGWLSRVGCDSAGSLRSLPKAVILKNTHPSSGARTKLLVAAGYMEQAAAPNPSTGTTQRLVAEAATSPTAANDGSEITDPKVVHAPPPPRPPPPATIRQVQVEVNRGPVMVMWAAAVALKLGHGRDTALSLARAVTNALDAKPALGIELRAASQVVRKEAHSGASGGSPTSVLLRVRSYRGQHTAERARDPASNRVIHPGPVGHLCGLRRGVASGARRNGAAGRCTEQGDTCRWHCTLPLYERFHPSVPRGKEGGARLGRCRWGSDANTR